MSCPRREDEELPLTTLEHIARNRDVLRRLMEGEMQLVYDIHQTTESILAFLRRNPGGIQ